ncbi:MAG: tetratricopeptide repeat protein, partial [Alphaproteobacteria bacterium]|nr:tetratricopeptide repeat protein [Alphaproteobacteria bacterium]
MRRVSKNSRVSAKAIRATALAFFVLAAFALDAEPSRADFEAGVRAYEAGEYQIALEEWRRLAAEEEPRALFNLGQMYRLGIGVQKDLGMAEQYYQRAAQQGHVGAHANLGSIYFSQDPPKEFVALYHWRIAARGGDPRAQYLLGVNYFNGDYLPLNYKQAYAWVSMAADAGLKDAEEAKQFIKGY